MHRIIDHINGALARPGVRAALFLLFLLQGCTEEKQPVVTLGAQASVQNALVWVAKEQGIFAQEGVEVKIKPYPSGKRALEGMLRGEVELAVMAETPLAIAAPAHPRLRIFATLGKSDNNICVLARRDRGVVRPEDLRGKRIATQRGSAVHFFLSSFLLQAGLRRDQVELRFLEVEELAEAFARGEVDAISMRDPVLERAEQMAGDGRSIRLCSPGLYTKTYNLVGWREFSGRHPEAMERILRALSRAALMVREEPRAALAVMEKRLQIVPERLQQIWSNVNFRLTLNQALLLSLREELRWAVSAGLLGPGVLEPGRLPDFLAMVETAPLQKVLPEAVGLIGVEEKNP
ncbi:MAG TPA: transporter substrate-binding domain-containing protein [Thiolapillus brandeum]|uniref:Transporter substrate-binding domain-containing protein n=1 Tax=Thiolapillus brandeum TaxID=1076588 RepID=A0A7C5J094_9GAMM|nr:transporter substrate-binding domain-containing protein [Thiolapillus brandeum]